MSRAGNTEAWTVNYLLGLSHLVWKGVPKIRRVGLHRVKQLSLERPQAAASVGVVWISVFRMMKGLSLLARPCLLGCAGLLGT